MTGLFFVLLVAACTTTDVLKDKARTSKDPCSDLAEIRSLPLNEQWPVDDIVYKRLSEGRDQAATCLLSRITDTALMPDPRSEPTKVNNFVIGDLAFFLLDDFKIVPFDDVLPAEVRAEVSRRGVLAYFDWVQKPGNRLALQTAAMEWVKAHPLNIEPVTATDPSNE